MQSHRGQSVSSTNLGGGWAGEALELLVSQPAASLAHGQRWDVIGTSGDGPRLDEAGPGSPSWVIWSVLMKMGVEEGA